MQTKLKYFLLEFWPLAKLVPKIAKHETFCQIFCVFFDTRMLMPAKVFALRVLMALSSVHCSLEKKILLEQYGLFCSKKYMFVSRSENHKLAL